MDRFGGKAYLFKVKTAAGLQEMGKNSYHYFPSKQEIRFDFRKSVAE